MGSTTITIRSVAMAAVIVSTGTSTAAAQKPAESVQALRLCFDVQDGDSNALTIEQCTAIIESGNASDDELWSAFHNRGMAYFRDTHADYARAISDLDRAVALGPLPTVLINRGRVHIAQHNYAAAISDFDRALASEPDNARAYYQRGIAYGEQSQFTAAMADLDRAAELAPNNYAYQNGRCRIRIVASLELGAARLACDEAVRLSPDPTSAMLLRGMVGIRQERWQDAWNDFDRLVQSEPDYASAIFGRGIAAVNLGRVEEGERDMARATEVRSSVVTDFAAFGITP